MQEKNKANVQKGGKMVDNRVCCTNCTKWPFSKPKRAAYL